MGKTRPKECLVKTLDIVVYFGYCMSMDIKTLRARIKMEALNIKGCTTNEFDALLKKLREAIDDYEQRVWLNEELHGKGKNDQ